MALDSDDGFVTSFNDTCDVFQLNPGSLQKIGTAKNITYALLYHEWKYYR